MIPGASGHGFDFHVQNVMWIFNFILLNFNIKLRIIYEVYQSLIVTLVLQSKCYIIPLYALSPTLAGVKDIFLASNEESFLSSKVVLWLKYLPVH